MLNIFRNRVFFFFISGEQDNTDNKITQDNSNKIVTIIAKSLSEISIKIL